MLEHICSPISMSSVSFFSSASRHITHPRLNPSNAIWGSPCSISEASRQVRRAVGERGIPDVRLLVDADCRLPVPRGVCLLCAVVCSCCCPRIIRQRIVYGAAAAGGQFIVDLGAHTHNHLPRLLRLPPPSRRRAASSPSRHDSSNSRRS